MAVRFRVLGPRAMGSLLGLYTSTEIKKLRNSYLTINKPSFIFSNTLYRAAICTAPLIKAGQIISLTYIGTAPVLASLSSSLGGTNENRHFLQCFGSVRSKGWAVCFYPRWFCDPKFGG